MLALVIPLAVEAQGFVVTGKVIHVTSVDSVPVRGQWAILHKVTLAGGASVDSVRTDAFGVYRLRAAELDTNSTYLVSVSHHGIAYFSEPVSTFGASADTARPLFVYDTSSTAPDIELGARHFVIRAPRDDGTRRVIELLVLENRGTETRISLDSSRPVWRGAIPPEALALEVGESDVSGETVFRNGDAIAVTAPVPPGERQVVVSYLLPRNSRTVTIPIDQPVARLNVLVEDPEATVVGSGLEPAGVEQIENSEFHRYEGFNVAAGTQVAVRFGVRSVQATDLWWVVIIVAGLTFAGGLGVWWKRSRTAAAELSADTLAALIAALDHEFEQRESAVSEAERERYHKRRAELEAQLSAALADRSAPL